jgi:tetratricopeptide (TPR) repeat protein
LLLLTVPILGDPLSAQNGPYPVYRSDDPPLPGANAITNLQVKQTRVGVWTADFDYYFTGIPVAAQLSIELSVPTSAPLDPRNGDQRVTHLPGAQRGAHHASFQISYPGSAQQTRTVAIVLRPDMYSKVALAGQQIDQSIDWPDARTWRLDQLLARAPPEANLKLAISYIDSEDENGFTEARALLEGLIRDNPRFDAAYVELARVTMKSQWGPGGLHQAEGLLQSALQIQPDSINAKVLLGYVYTHQRRYAPAEALFAQAASVKSDNLWLWSNWGELLAMEGKTDQAMLKYRQAIAHPMTHDTYDRARTAAYQYLINLLKLRLDLDGMEALYKQRIAEFGPGSCYSADYSRFLLQARGDAQAAIDVSTRALNQSCDDAPSREVLGLAQYVKWSATTGPSSLEALNQARLYLPAGPRPLYLLAASDRTLAAAKRLVASGEEIDQKDNDQMTALAYAFQEHELESAKRLLALGARPETPVGESGLPVALLPVFDGHVDGIRLMRKNGVNYSKLKFQGNTAYEIAKSVGNPAVLAALGSKEAEL